MATKMESNENVVMTFYNPEVPKVKGKRTYQKPTLPTNKHPGASMPPQRRQQDVHQTHTYIRMFCGSLCGFSFLVAVCTSPLSWVQLLVIRDGAELYAGLWTLCSHELCWTHTPRPPSACLLLCLGLFLEQVSWHSKDAMEPDFLWTYHLNWWGDFLYTSAGIISFLNYISLMVLPSDQSAAVPEPVEASRLGIGPVTTEELAEDEESDSS
nr:transmembrane protein 202 isoform X6 [Oryctolagus cuniculus]